MLPDLNKMMMMKRISRLKRAIFLRFARASKSFHLGWPLSEEFLKCNVEAIGVAKILSRVHIFS